MLWYILRRVIQSFFTILGVMVVTFLLFRVVAGDVASANLGPKATRRAKAEWRHKHGYDRPMFFNTDRRILIEDYTIGELSLKADPKKRNEADDALGLIMPGKEETEKFALGKTKKIILGRFVPWLKEETLMEKIVVEKEENKKKVGNGEKEKPLPPLGLKPVLDFQLSDGSKLSVNLDGVVTCGDFIDKINNSPDNTTQDGKKKVEAKLTEWHFTDLFNSQFFHHLVDSITFNSRSLSDNRKLTTIIKEHAPASLSFTVPAMVIGWILSLVISCFVAYYRDSIADKLGVFLSVLGMCVPFLAFMILGQWLMFKISPKHAYGIFYRSNVYVPIAIMVIAGLGGSVRFYRTIILNETNRDYVRTARAKGVPLPSILFKHILKNCMLPILTNLIMAIPFLIMGSLLVESYFGIPGLGDLMISSINSRNEPIMSGMVFLTALIYTGSVLLTDISYSLFDPRIRLK